MPTMTISEAEKIIDIVSAALEDTRHHHPVSALRGYDIYQIVTALKLRVANEFLLLAGRPDFAEKFAEGLRLYDSIPWQIMRSFVPDDQVGSISPDLVFSPIDRATMKFKDQRLAAEETPSSFGDYCKFVRRSDPDYWQKVYARLHLDFTATSPKGSDPVLPDEVPDDGSIAQEVTTSISNEAAFNFFRHSSVFLIGVVVFFAIGRGLYSLLDDVFPTQTGSTADTIKTWSFLLIFPIAGFVTACFWKRMRFTGKEDET